MRGSSAYAKASADEGAVCSGRVVKRVKHNSIYLLIKKREGRMKPKIISDKNFFGQQRSYTPEDVLAAGGTTAFGLKNQKRKEEAIKALKNAPPIEPFSDEEWAKLMDEVARDK